MRSLVYVLCFMLERSVRILALLSCFRLSSVFVSGFGHSCSRFGLAVGACGLEFAWAVRSSVRLICFVLHADWAHFVAHSLFFGCALSCLSCFVWTRGLWVSFSCVFVSRFAHGQWFCLAGHVRVFLFCVSTWLILFGSICHVLSCPTHLVSWLLVHLPHLCCPTFSLSVSQNHQNF